MKDLFPEGNDIDLNSKEFSGKQSAILAEYETKKCVVPLKYDEKATLLNLPTTGSKLAKTVSLDKTGCVYKKLIFSAINRAFYEYFFTDEYPLSNKLDFHSHVSFFVDYLNAYDFAEGNELSFFKSYETFRINEHNVLPSSTGLASVIKWIRLVSTIGSYANSLAHWQVRYLVSVAKIRSLGKTAFESKQVTMTDWFSCSSWLRRDDVGIGHELFSKLASPKALVNSFLATITAEMHEIQTAKEALIKFFRENKIKPSDFPSLRERREFKSTLAHTDYIQRRRTHELTLLSNIYEQSSNKDKDVKLAMALVIREFALPHSIERLSDRFFNNEEIAKCINGVGGIQDSICSNAIETFFGSKILAEIAEYVNCPNSKSMDKPKSLAEQHIFAWLMAYQTVQPSDILKLSLSNFRLVKRVNGQVTHIDLSYFKGRSNAVHQVRTLETKRLVGSVVLNYLQDISSESSGRRLIDSAYVSTSTFDKLFEFCGSEIVDRVNANLVREKASPVFIKAVLAIIRNGDRFSLRGWASTEEYFSSSELPRRKTCFSLTAIKNSSIHSRSDTFTPTQLINFHSHSDDVEKLFYLSSSNEEWLNNSGLITRAVMHDLATNLYRASLTERALFNSEFTHAAEIITNKKNETLSLMKMVTGEAQGEVNALGLLKNIAKPDPQSIDTIYVLDTPETIVRLLHYLDQVRLNHRSLVAASPEFLLFTVLPTAEWIEDLFDNKSFSKESMCEGENMYKKYKDNLPPLFQNNLR